MKDKLLTGATAYRKKNGHTKWLIVKEDGQEGWVLPTGDVRRGESSVRAAMRLLRDNIGMRSKVLEEAGRATISTTENGEPLSQKLIFYLIRRRVGGEKVNGYVEQKWIPYSQARRSLAKTTEKRILRQANETLKEWRKQKREA